MELINLISLAKSNLLEPVRIESLSSNIELSRKTSLHFMVSSFGTSLGIGIKWFMIGTCCDFTASSPTSKI